MKKIIYTVIFGDGDTLKTPTYVTPGWSYVCYTNQDFKDTGPWEINKTWIQKEIGDKLASRGFKIGRPPKGDIVIYIDGTYKIVGDLDEFVKDMEDGVHMTPHPQRNCLFLESEVVIKKQLDSPEKVNKQIERYRAEGYPENNGLFRGGCIVRIGDTSKFNEAWFQEVLHGSWRDQISMCYTSWKTGIPIHPIEHGRVEKYFKPYLHNPRNLEDAPIFFNPENPHNLPKNSWTVIGAVSSAEVVEKISKHPLIHCIRLPEGTIIQTWVYDYIQDVPNILHYMRVYKGSVVDYTFDFLR